MATQDECDVFVELSALLLAQGEHSNADDRQDELQPLHVPMQADGELLIAGKLRVDCWVCGVSA
jgi:hypothetical protein